VYDEGELYVCWGLDDGLNVSENRGLFGDRDVYDEGWVVYNDLGVCENWGAYDRDVYDDRDL
jgi:hypothetical protein